MHILQLELNQGTPSTEIRVTPQFLNQSSVWFIEMDGIEAMIRKDDAGYWMQRSRDNLSPEMVAKVGQAIEDIFIQMATGT